jgi:hypothetical protein
MLVAITLRLAQRSDLAAIVEATAAEKSECVAPTHVVEQDGKVIGYGSAGRIGLLAGWMSESVSDESSMATFREMENAAGQAGVKIILVACTDDCRFKPFMEAEGYTAGGKPVTLYYKKVR